MSLALSGLASDCISLRWRATCTVAELTSKARKARVLALLCVYRSSERRWRIPLRSPPIPLRWRICRNEDGKDYRGGSVGHYGVGFREPGRRDGELARTQPADTRRLANARTTAAEVSQSLHRGKFHRPAILLQSLRDRLSILLLLVRLIRVLSPGPWLLRLGRPFALLALSGKSK